MLHRVVSVKRSYYKLALLYHPDRVGINEKEEAKQKFNIIHNACGNSKPTKLNDFLGPFVTEMKEIMENPISINDFQIVVLIRCFICDTPARAFIKGISFCLFVHRPSIS